MVKIKPKVVIDNLAKAQLREAYTGSYRAFKIYKYRVSYHVSKEQITVIMIRHTGIKPKSH
jgi:hypothetical protein